MNHFLIFLLQLWVSFAAWLRQLFGRGTTPYGVILSEELPEALLPRKLYLMGEEEPWQAAMTCPCGCQAIIQLSLLHDDAPHWRLAISRRNVPTLTPSVWRTTGCRSHFFLRDGLIVWCGDSEV